MDNAIIVLKNINEAWSLAFLVKTRIQSFYAIFKQVSVGIGP